jgi:hypothetical protein
MPRVLYCLLAILCLAGNALAQSTRPVEPATQPAGELQVSVLIYGPGGDIYERFGHCGLRIRLPGRFDIACDWGVFEFDSLFVLKFAKKDLRYWMEVYESAPAVIETYRRLGRSVTEYELDLSPEQARSALQRIVTMNRPENRYYNYDYYTNNCATLLRDVIDASVDGQIKAQTAGTLTEHTYRWHTRRHLPVGALNAFATALADVSMGPRIDLPLSAWETMFLPVEMGPVLQSVRLKNDDGTTRPLVKRREQVFAATNPSFATPDAPATVWPYALIAGAIGAAVVVVARRRRWATILLVIAWAMLGTLWAAFMLATWAFSQHVVPAWNQNLLVLSPLAIVLLVAVPWKRWQRAASLAAIAIAVTSGVAVLLHLLPFVPRQGNVEALLVAVPINVAVAWALLERKSKGSESCEREVAEVESPRS